MKLYAFTTPDIPNNAGYLKIGETRGSVENRIKDQGHTLNTRCVEVWRDSVITDRSRVDKRIHQYLREQGFDNPKYPDTGEYTELVKCSAAELKKAFEIVKQQIYAEEKQREEVGEQFYIELRNWFYWTLNEQTLQQSGINAAEYTLRIIVRLMLCFFFCEKKLVPQELFNERWLNDNLKEDGCKFYNVVLRNLFFHCLNIPMKGRKDFENVKLIQNISKVKEQFQQIPFLNGGLFDELKDDDFALPNEYFFGEKRLVKLEELDGGKYDAEGIIHILSKYHYKLSLDDLIEYADYKTTIDPEFLGKVFESLLACVDSDNKDNRRKITGSFYTPREIVDYMVNESLDEYLKTNGDLLQCKILDPACGSGAFPCGIMNAVMNRLYADVQLSPEDKYRKKLEILQKVIYGIDIQPMAVQITVLRLFLSLIQDIKPDKSKDNYGIEPLPNLETKFVCANALIGLPPKKFRDLPIVAQTIKALTNVRQQHFSAKYSAEKTRLREFDMNYRNILIEVYRDPRNETYYTDDSIKLLMKWNPYTQISSAPFFDSQWMFGIDNFDIVIGNPPYVEHKKLKKRAAGLKEKYEVFSGTADLSVYFIEKGISLCKENGLVMYIITNKFFNAEYGKPVREFILKHGIRTLINFEQVKIFETALVSSVILGLTPQKQKDEFTFEQFVKISRKEFYKQFAERKKHFTGTFRQSQLGKDEWTFADKTQIALKTKIEKAGIKLGTVKGVAVYRGVTTGYNPAFIISKEQADELIQTDAKNAEIIKPLLQGRNIRRWIYNDTKDFLILTRQGINIEDYPKIKKHLRQFRKQLKPGGKGGRKDGSYQWYEIQDITAYYPEFGKEKIIWGLTADKWAFAYDDAKHYLPSNGYILTSEKVPVKYLLGLLNSKLMQYYFGFIGVMTAGGAYTLKHATVIKLPVVIAEDTQPLIKLVEQCLNGKAVDDEIDKLVYQLYGLTDGEIKLAEDG